MRRSWVLVIVKSDVYLLIMGSEVCLESKKEK